MTGTAELSGSNPIATFMSTPGCQIRLMTRAELDLAVAWAAREGWNPGMHDADSFFAADPGGFLIGLLEDRPIACISAVRYEHAFAFVGFYLVEPDCRGQGYGMQIWNAAMERLQGRSVGLDGVVAQQENYRKSGFELAYRNIRFQGTGGGGASSANDRIIPLTSLAPEAVEAYDRRFFPASRGTFLRSWIHQPQSVAAGLLRNGELAGYGVLRRCLTGFKIGPLFAGHPADAESLFTHLRAQVPAGEPIFLDVPEANPAAVALAQRHQLEVVFETARMYRSPPPPIDLAGVYGVTSFELG